MKGDDNPSETRAKMIALLSLLDVLKGDAIMSAVAIERVGTATGGRFAGKVRLKFSVFGNDARLLELATELTRLGSDAEIRRFLESRIDVTDKLRFCLGMIESWSEAARRLLDLQPERRGLPPGVPALPSGAARLRGGDQ